MFRQTSILTCLALMAFALSGYAQEPGEDAWVTPIQPQEFTQIKSGLTQPPNVAARSTPLVPLADRLAHLSPDEQKVIQAIERKGYLAEAELQSQVLQGVAPEATNAMITNLLTLQLIRTAGVEPQRMLMLSESLLKSLTASPVAPSPSQKPQAP